MCDQECSKSATLKKNGRHAFARGAAACTTLGEKGADRHAQP